MSLTLSVWLGTFSYILYKSIFNSSAWGVILYIFVFLLFPPAWWWGKSLPFSRWSLLAGVILLVSTIFHNKKQNTKVDNSHDDKNRFTFNRNFVPIVCFLLILNYFFVHFVLAADIKISAERFTLALKFIFLFFLIITAIRKSDDLILVWLTILFSLGFLGYQINFNDIGGFVKGRLEYLPIPGARSSNLFASLLVIFIVPLGALFFSSKSKKIKFFVFLCMPFILNMIFLVNSRGAYLGLIGACLFLILIVKKNERKIVFYVGICTLIAISFLAKDEKIFQRFQTIFVAEDEKRDASASQRMFLWRAALDLIADHPLGTGGDGFRKVHGYNYASRYGITQFRAVHNGYLSIGCEWGIQGLGLVVALIYFIASRSIKAANFLLHRHNLFKESFFVKACVSGLMGFLICAMFTTVLDEEWLYWMLGFLYSIMNLVAANRFHFTESES